MLSNEDLQNLLKLLIRGSYNGQELDVIYPLKIKLQEMLKQESEPSTKKDE